MLRATGALALALAVDDDDDDHPLAEHPLPITDPQLVKLDGGFEDPVLALP